MARQPGSALREAPGEVPKERGRRGRPTQEKAEGEGGGGGKQTKTSTMVSSADPPLHTPSRFTLVHAVFTLVHGGLSKSHSYWFCLSNIF